jgi:hypothetical protein
MKKSPWLFSAPVDLALFGGTAVISLLLLGVGPLTGGEAMTPEWSWIVGVLLVDIAHVWSTAFVIYLDPAEWRRRPLLYGVTPIVAFGIGVAIYAHGGQVWFWRFVAYLAVFHFVRQQFGWVMMYRARNGERDSLGRWIDGAMIYAATLYPLIVWHCEPRLFNWMKPKDFVVGAPDWIATVALYLYLAIAAAYLARAVVQRPVSWGKHVVVATTAACWYAGIVATNSDYAFTVTNVFIHGVPYLALVYVYARAASREPESAHGLTAFFVRRRNGLLVFLATLWAIAYVEELLWDRAVWHDREWLFGSALDLGPHTFIAPLLAVPQLTHYFLDAFLWRRASNPRVGRLL